MGSLAFHVSSVATNRPSIITVLADGVPLTQFHDVLGDAEGKEWDALSLPVTVPAGATTLTVQLLAEDSNVGPLAGFLPASLVWIVSSLTLAPQ